MDAILPNSKPRNESKRKTWLIGDEYSCTNWCPPYPKDVKGRCEEALKKPQGEVINDKEKMKQVYKDTRIGQRQEVETLTLDQTIEKYYWFKEVRRLAFNLNFLK